MKKVILIALLGTLMVGCSNQAGDKTNKENVTLVENYIKAVEALDYEAMGNYLAGDYMGNGPSYGDTIYKAQAVANWKDNVDNLYESIHYDRSRCEAFSVSDAEGGNNGDWVINWAELNIKFKADSTHVIIWAITSYQVENGKISKSITVYNEADALRQLGYKIVPGEASN